MEHGVRSRRDSDTPKFDGRHFGLAHFPAFVLRHRIEPTFVRLFVI